MNKTLEYQPVLTCDKTEMYTHLGTMFDPVKLDFSKVTVEEIAWAGARLSRFGGHCGWDNYIYSVAQHCVYVARLSHPCERLEGLHHDDTEMLGLVDIPRPIKETPQMEPYRSMESIANEAVIKKFNLKPVPNSVKWADDMVLLNELRIFQPWNYKEAKTKFLIQGMTEVQIYIEPWSIKHTEEEFLKMHYRLVAERSPNFELDETSGYPGVRS